MKSTELLAVVRAHYDEIIEALRDADRAAYEDTTCEYSVALMPDGTLERRERLAGSNEYYYPDPALIEFGPLCHQYFDPLRDLLASDELLYLLESEMDEIERTEYDRYRADFFGTEEEYPDDWDAVNWIEESLSVWERVEHDAIEELVTMPEAIEQYEAIVDRDVDLMCDWYESDETN